MAFSREELRARILSLSAQKEPLKTPIFGDEADSQLAVRELTAEESATFRNLKNAAGQWDENQANGFVFCTCLIDNASGLPVFDIKDSQAVTRQLGISVVRPVVDQALTLSKATRGAVADAKNASNPTQSDGSSSNSVSGSDALNTNSSNVDTSANS
jgi:hypothetical protein